MPRRHADAFETFCRANAQACPIVDIVMPGQAHPAVAHGADLRTDVPRYHVFRHGELVEEKLDVIDAWPRDMVAFLIGCSFTFEHRLLAAGIPLRHVAENRNVAMYRTNVRCQPAGPFHGELVVSMRPIAARSLDLVHEICAALPQAHGVPVHVGSPERLGIVSLEEPDFGDGVRMETGETPVFWACGVTASQAARAARLPLTITHAPGHMFVTDLKIGPSSNDRRIP
jgi:uncharacterized protein YcsI (UPF0317 family)